MDMDKTPSPALVAAEWSAEARLAERRREVALTAAVQLLAGHGWGQAEMVLDNARIFAAYLAGER